LPLERYFSPLCRYFCLRTLGSLEQPTNRASANNRGQIFLIAWEVISVMMSLHWQAYHASVWKESAERSRSVLDVMPLGIEPLPIQSTAEEVEDARQE
jgi:hypothetical protein